MCDIRLFRSVKADYDTAVMIWKNPYNDEMINHVMIWTFW